MRFLSFHPTLDSFLKSKLKGRLGGRNKDNSEGEGRILGKLCREYIIDFLFLLCVLF